MQAPEPGLYHGMPAAEYHAIDACSQSRLTMLHKRSAAHVRWHIDHPGGQTDAMRIGAAVHDAVLLPTAFSLEWVVRTQCEGTTAKGEQCSKAGTMFSNGLWYCHQHIGSYTPEVVNPLSRDEYAGVIALRDAIAAHPYASALLEGDAEVSAFWDDPETGVRCKGRFDLLSKRKAVIVDLKTCQDSSPEAFSRHIFDYGIHIQAAMYLSAAKALSLPHDAFAVVAIEKAEPYEIALYDIDMSWTWPGETLRKGLMRRYAQCLASGYWPGYGEGVQTIRPLRWMEYQFDEIEREAR